MIDFAILNLPDSSDPLDTFICEQCDQIATTMTIPLNDDHSLSDDSNDQIALCTEHALINSITLILTRKA
jgi:hypothetical protein